MHLQIMYLQSFKYITAQTKVDIAMKEKKNIYILNENAQKNRFLGYFSYLGFKYTCCCRNSHNYKLFLDLNSLKRHIRGKFDILKYYKSLLNYKYFKMITLNNQQRMVLKNICELKNDYRLIIRERKEETLQINKEIEKFKDELNEETEINQKIKNLIDMKFYGNY